MEPDPRLLIDELAAELTPVRRPPSLAAGFWLWLLASVAFVTAITLATGPMRPGFAAQLAASPRFALESLLGFGAAALAMLGALRLARPGDNPLRTRALPGLGLLGLWVIALGVGFVSPALEPSMLGKRPHCVIETQLYAVPPLLLGLWLLRRLAPLQRVWTGALAGAGAGALPALIMNFACMYAPQHVLFFHLGPAFLVIGVGAWLGSRVLPRL